MTDCWPLVTMLLRVYLLSSSPIENSLLYFSSSNEEKRERKILETGILSLIQSKLTHNDYRQVLFYFRIKCARSKFSIRFRRSTRSTTYRSLMVLRKKGQGSKDLWSWRSMLSCFVYKIDETWTISLSDINDERRTTDIF